MVFRNGKCLFPALIGVLLAGMMFSLPAAATESVSLGSLDVSKVRQGWGRPQADKSVDGHTISIGGEKLNKGWAPMPKALCLSI
jgi:hypothetical protein